MRKTAAAVISILCGLLIVSASCNLAWSSTSNIDTNDGMKNDGENQSPIAFLLTLSPPPEKPVQNDEPNKQSLEDYSSSFQSSSADNSVSRGISWGITRLILKKAVSLLGTRYVYGGSSPKGFDCSGFTSFVYSSVGINLPHNAAAQFKEGRRVDKGSLVPGDLVFFSFYGSKTINHVGIYVGGGKFIHASSSGRKVMYSALNSLYYSVNYRGASRIIR